MKVYNEDKTEILEEYDLEKGELELDTITIHHEEIVGQEEEGHYEVVAEYPNGGKDVEYIIDKPYIEHQDAYDEEEQIQVYVPYSNEYLEIKELENNIANLKEALKLTDYKAIKYAEGWFTEEEYLPIKEERQLYRDKINEYEEQIRELSE